MSKFKLLQILLITGTLVVAGCSSTGSEDAGTGEAPEDDSVAMEETDTADETDMAAVEEEEAPEPEETVVEEPEMAVPEQTVVYFEFDSFALDSESRAILDEHVAYMRDNSDAVVVLEGHTDERGSAEYNLALGENRAKSVQDYMNLRGTSNSQMYVTSFGEMNPAVAESNEEAWAQNRRVEIKYQD